MKKFFALFLLSQICHVIYSQPTAGLLQYEPSVNEGYVLFAPLQSRNTYLIDRCGRLVHQWKSKYKPGQSAYLLPDGNLLRCGNDSNTAFVSGGGRIEKIRWDGKLAWSYCISTPTSCLHHDIYPMPNGNVLAILWEKKTPEAARAAGRKPELTGKSVWSEKIIELKPIDTDKAIIVWEWSMWDHLVQDIDPKLPNYGDVAANPQLININYKASSDEDWLHFNSVSYNQQLNQVIISNRNFSEIYVLDHSTTSAQARSHVGGKCKKGGDILYRWGNPAAYNKGTPEEQMFYLQHSAHWIGKGLADEGKIMVFNNGTERPGEVYSSVEIIEPSVDANGNYAIGADGIFLPKEPSWRYPGELPEHFYSKNVSNAQRLPNGNTLICEGANGRFFEITPAKNVIWNYVNPVTPAGPVEQGTPLLQNQVFRCIFYGSNYPGLKGKALNPGKVLELNPTMHFCEEKTR